MAKTGRRPGPRQSVIARLESNVVVDNNNCWIWQLGKNNLGYGLMRVGNKMRTPHRVSYEHYNNTTIPVDMCVLHTCDNPICCNPQHLWLGTRSDNTQDMIKKKRHKFWGDSTRSGVKQPTDKCKYCGVTQPVNTLSRYHNDKCKHKPVT